VHHFEVASSDIVGDEFRIVLRNSITGHQTLVTGSAMGLAMERGRRASNDQVRRLADRLARAVAEVEMQMDA
jgi:hypothetical protein